MNRGPTFSAMAFSVGNFKVTCEVEESLLKLSLSSISSPEPLKLSLSKLVSSDSNIDLVIQALPPSCAFASPPNTKTANEQPIAALHEKLTNLQREMKSLENRISAKGPNQGLNAKHYRILGRSLKGGEMHLHDESEQDSQARMQLLNNVLQEKLLEKEGNIVQLERRLLEREELVRELADKLITANIEKQDIFVQYEKILQNTVFSKLQQPKPEQGEGDPEVLALEVKEQENQLEAVQ